MLNLRPYQSEALEAIHQLEAQGQRRQLISLPTASGKTVIFGHLIQHRKQKALVLAHTGELLEQARDKIQMICPGLEVGLVNGQHKEFGSPVVVASIQSAAMPHNLERLQQQDFQLIIADEAHHYAADSPRRIIEHLGFGKGTDRLLVGFTATAFRQDGRGLAEVFDTIAYERSIKQMVEDGYLCRPNGLRIATDLDLSKVRLDGEDFQATSLAAVMDTPEINHLIAEAYVQHAFGQQAIAFGVTVQHAVNLAEALKQRGISAKAIHGSMGQEERAKAIADYRSGSLKVLTNCQVLIEGFDAPETSCIIVARPTQSRGLYQQMVGRGLRLWPNKRECLILDLGDRSHSLCNTATLLMDSEKEDDPEEKQKKSDKETIAKLPPNLNQKLKSAILSFDPLGESFIWERDVRSYFIKGIGMIRLEVVAISEDRHGVILFDGFTAKTIADGLTFEYAFSTAEGFAKENKSLFVVADKEAPWRNLPISEKQAAFIRKRGFKAGVDRLTRGQAAALIGSGALNEQVNKKNFGWHRRRTQHPEGVTS